MNRREEKAEGLIDARFLRYNPIFINEIDRKKETMPYSRYRTRTNGLMVKTGDFIEVAKGSFVDPSSHYVPIRMKYQDIQSRNPVFTLDMLDAWGQSSTIGQLNDARRYDSFTELFHENFEELVAENIFGACQFILVDDKLRVLYEEKRKFKEENAITGLLNFFKNRYPFPDVLDPSESFSPLNEIPVEELVVEAVLHPLYGLPKILLRERNPELDYGGSTL
jgi:hypothetical protein